MISPHRLLYVGAFCLAAAAHSVAQTPSTSDETRLVVTGARFAYPLLQQWIADYKKVDSTVSIVIAPRTESDPKPYDLLLEAFEPEPDTQRELTIVARYPVLIVANASSDFALSHANKGLTRKTIRQIFFHDVFQEKAGKQGGYTIYRRLQRAGAPTVFSRCFGYEQKDIKGKAVAGSDEHLLFAIQRDTAALSFLPLPLVYDLGAGTIRRGLEVIPTDLDDDNKLNDDERFYENLQSVIDRLESEPTPPNLPMGVLLFSVDKGSVRPEAFEFIEWVRTRGQEILAEYGFLKPETASVTKNIDLPNKRINK